MAAKTEAVGKGHIHLPVTRHVGDIIQVAIFGWTIKIDRWWHDTVTDRQKANDRLYGTGRCNQVPHHAFRTRDRNRVGRFAQGFFNGQCFDLVVDFRACAVSVDIVDVFRLYACIGHGFLEARNGASAFIVTVGDPEGIGRRSIADQFAVDSCSTTFCVLQLFQNNHSGAFAQNESVPVFIEWTTRLLWFTVAGGKGRQKNKSSHPKWVDHAVSTTGKDHIGIASTDLLQSLANRL